MRTVLISYISTLIISYEKRINIGQYNYYQSLQLNIFETQDITILIKLRIILTQFSIKPFSLSKFNTNYLIHLSIGLKYSQKDSIQIRLSQVKVKKANLIFYIYKLLQLIFTLLNSVTFFTRQRGTPSKPKFSRLHLWCQHSANKYLATFI